MYSVGGVKDKRIVMMLSVVKGKGMRRAAGIPKMDTRKRLFHPTRTRQSQWGGRRRRGINPISQALDKGPARHCTLVGVPLMHARPLLQPFDSLRGDGTTVGRGSSLDHIHPHPVMVCRLFTMVRKHSVQEYLRKLQGKIRVNVQEVVVRLHARTRPWPY